MRNSKLAGRYLHKYGGYPGPPRSRMAELASPVYRNENLCTAHVQLDFEFSCFIVRQSELAGQQSLHVKGKLQATSVRGASRTT